jgi:transcriptional regulator with XRE-family HTH domain
MGERESQKEGGLGQRLRRARTRLYWTREELAVRAGISWSAIAQIESGRRRNVRPDTLLALAHALEVTTDYLVHGSSLTPVMLEHQALFYGSGDEFLETVGPVLGEGLERSEPTLLATSNANVALARRYLGARSRRIRVMASAELYADADGTRTLKTFQRFVERHLRGGAPWVRIVGEPVWAGRSRAQVRRWCRYESLLNLAFAALPVTIICPYDERTVTPSILRQARATHPETIGGGLTAASSDYVPPSAFVLGENTTG